MDRSAGDGRSRRRAERTISLDDPDYTLSGNDSFQVNDREYTVASVSGGQAEAERTNESAILFVMLALLPARS